MGLENGVVRRGESPEHQIGVALAKFGFLDDNGATGFSTWRKEFWRSRADPANCKGGCAPARNKIPLRHFEKRRLHIFGRPPPPDFGAVFPTPLSSIPCGEGVELTPLHAANRSQQTPARKQQTPARNHPLDNRSASNNHEL